MAPLNPDARDLEEEFFARENQRLLEHLKDKRDQSAKRAALRQVMPSADDEFVDHILELGIGPEMVLAITLVPLVVVAWADGDIAPREREAIMKAAEERGVAPKTAPYEVLESWLKHKPGPALVQAWRRYVKTLGTDLSPQERDQVRERGLGLAREVAEAAGGFLGLSKISAAERAALEELEQIFD
jgi:hypothetical protein